ncbi:MAG: prephenate dehydrogenase/arogenate dehydrogenase family protein [Leptospiraceae bacterium]|nr:prephenate dehydrogenase/arogenate dehydrogenase family protein [Leptospiraceae bacterium]MDW7976462.1 prephenate dehydrogenase/arogenate dehydrogenase family protein [Leptospiraceae bacterium]
MSVLTSFRNVIIYGMGMMGTSLAYALKNHPSFKGRIIGVVRNEKSKTWILENQLADEVWLSEEAEIFSRLKEVDFLIIGLPVLDTLDLLEKLEEIRFSGLITDMGSTRIQIENKARQLESSFPLRFVGAHPICGSEHSGPEGYVKNLFENKLCIIINRLSQNHQEDRNPKDQEAVSSFWQELRMKVFLMDAETHDYVLSYLSHAPHILSSVLSTIIGRNKIITRWNQESPIPILGGGLRDMLRIAGSNPKMWFDIISTNKQNILQTLKDYQKELEYLISIFENDEWKDWWWEWQTKAKIYRDTLYGNSQ